MTLENFDERDLNLLRQWFNALEDVSPEYLERSDYELAKRIYAALGIAIPASIGRMTPHD